MDQKEKKSVKNPRQNANVLSIVTFGWLLKTFLEGYKRKLEIGDLFSPLNEHASTVLGDRMEKLWNTEKAKGEDKKKNSQPSLLKILLACFGKWLVIIGIAQAFWEFILRICQPLILAKLLRFLSGKDVDDKGDIYIWALAFILCSFVDTYMMHFSMYGLMHLGLKLRVACTTLIYRKILRLSSSVLDNGTSVGQMVNLINTDVSRLDYMVFSIHYLWIGPIQTVIITYFVWREIGWPAVVGMLTFLIFIPLQAVIGKQFSKLTRISAYRTDDRLRLMNEIIAGIEVIKMYVWEKPFSLLVEKARRKEIKAIKKFSIIQAITFTFDMYVPRLCLFVTIVAYVLTGNHIDAEKVYMIAAYYGVLRVSMTINFPMSIGEVVEGLVSLKRLQKFMLQPEVQKPSDTSSRKSSASSTLAISVQNITAKWSSDTTEDTLSDVSLSVKPGQLVAIVGQVGAGKSSLLQAVLRELPPTSGSLEVSGSIAYASQLPWIFASSVRQNILFGQPMDQARYERTLQVCQLKPDIATFSHGDMTVVGPRGISLSGGQRARINLARAIYAEADIYLLDDPLSAVDSHVGRRIVEDCICGYLKGKTRLLVTHQLQYLRNADLVVIINNGRIEAQGSYDDICAAGIDLTKLIEPTNEKVDSPTDEKTESPYFGSNGTSVKFEAANGDKPDKAAEEKGSNAVEEKAETGSISGEVYLSYFKAVKSNFLVIVTFLVMMLSQSVGTGCDYFLSFWVNVEESSNFRMENGTREFVWKGPFSRDWFLYLYSIIVAATIVLCLYQLFLCFKAFMRASRNLHNDMFRSITRTRMAFFNVNPSGRVLNRFSKDMFAIDRRLPDAMMDVILVILILFTVIVVIGVVNAWLLIPIIILALIFFYLRLFYICTSRSIKRLEGVTRSPVNDHVTVTLQGLTTVRAFKAQDILSLEFDRHHDTNTSASFMFQSTSRAFGLYLQLCCTIYVSFVTYFFLIFDDLTSAGDVGLILTQCITVTGFLQWGMRQTAEVESNMTCVERVLEYSKLEEEPQLESNPEKKPPKEWPTCGHVQFKDVRLKYSPKGGYVLKGLTFEIKPREKIGIVGRTGAGKTSLISALFRLAIVEGEIIIDGISTGSIGLHDFRSKISIIPQEPVLFAGKLRQNLDPFEEFPDDVLWQALQEVELKDVVTAMGAGLNARVAEGGSNFSVGQRQLLCLARAVIRNNKIMVLDEATANVDPLTDSLIQATVRKKFRDCTVLTVAHRLNTVMDSDRVLVMNGGHLAEFDSPYKLLQNKDLFYSMVQQTGPAMAATLTKIAEDTYLSKNDEAPSR